MTSQLTTSVNPHQTVEEAFRAILETNLFSVKEWEPIAITGEDIEGVHQMRVGLRRMRSALSVFRPAIPKMVTRSFANDMRWAAKALDRARDLDVYITDNFQAKGNKHQRKIQCIAKEHREEAYSRVRGIIQRKRYSTFNRELTNWLDTKAWRGQLSEEDRKSLQRKITPFAGQVLDTHFSGVHEAGKEIEKMDSEALHRLRIECKKLRYATEFFSPLYNDQMKEFTKHLKALQDTLGILHDTAVLSGLQDDLLKDNRCSKLKRVAIKLENKRLKESNELKKNLIEQWRAFTEAEHPWSNVKYRKAAA